MGVRERERSVRMVSRYLTGLSRCYSTQLGRRVGVWGASFDQGQPHRGTTEAPRLLREAGLIQTLVQQGLEVRDFGDEVMSREEKDTVRTRQEAVSRYSRVVHDKVLSILSDQRLALTLGGDHSVALGSLAGSLAHCQDTVVVWVDAHTDINTMSTSNSGNMHGMPVSFNIPQLREDFTHADLSWLQPRLKAARLVYIGLRDVEREERRALERLNIPAYFMSDVDRLGLTRVVEDSLQRVDSEASRRIHLSFDIDALDPSEAPATGTPVRGGLTLREGMTLCDMLHSTGRLQAVDLVEINPLLVTRQHEVDRTVQAALHLIYSALGLRDVVSFHQ